MFFSTFSSPRETLNLIRQYPELIKNLWFSYCFFDVFLSQRYLKPHQASRCGFQDSRIMALPRLGRWSGAECAPEVQPQMHTNSARAHAGTRMLTQTM